jgi:predicted DNA-binding transcriptional regulator AlpA
MKENPPHTPFPPRGDGTSASPAVITSAIEKVITMAGMMGDRPPDEPRARRMLNEKQVLAIVPIARSTLWRMEKTGKFPKGSYILGNRKLWFEDEVMAWQNAVDGQVGRKRRPRAKTAKQTD